MKDQGQIYVTTSLTRQQHDLAMAHGYFIQDVALTTISYLPFPKTIEQVDALVFTSKNAVKHLPHYTFSGSIYASGKQTAKALLKKSYKALQGQDEDAASLATKMIADGVRSAVFFCGNLRRNELPNKLKAEHIKLIEHQVYTTQLSPKLIDVKKGDSLFFLSPSAVESYAQKNTFEQTFNYYCIGNTTAKSLVSKGINDYYIAPEASFEAMLKQYTTVNN
jgi:uroporphyrinogen-III synthase